MTGAASKGSTHTVTYPRCHGVDTANAKSEICSALCDSFCSSRGKEQLAKEQLAKSARGLLWGENAGTGKQEESGCKHTTRTPRGDDKLIEERCAQ